MAFASAMPMLSQPRASASTGRWGENSAPAERARVPTHARTHAHSQGVDTSTGVELSVVEPLPSWPLLLFPQQ